MSQVFAADSVNNSNSVTLPTTTQTAVVTGNFLNPPFQNAKAIVIANCYVSAGTGTTAVSLRLFRNPGGENLLLVNQGGVTLAAPNVALVSVQWADSIPDGRAVQYQLSVQQTGATANGIATQANITVLLISG